eukprot:m.240214 g.240214  ORF g.240214 m.240214 type:complete len:320 (-) comp14669_c0_seq1:126-1085(-)
MPEEEQGSDTINNNDGEVKQETASKQEENEVNENKSVEEKEENGEEEKRGTGDPSENREDESEGRGRDHSRSRSRSRSQSRSRSRDGESKKEKETENNPVAVGTTVVDRSKMCPFLLRVFYRFRAHNNLDDYKGGKTPKNEVTIYTWTDATLKELGGLLKEVNASIRRKGTKLVFSSVFHTRRSGAMAMREFGSIKNGEKGGDDLKTLLSLNFHIGDFIDVAVIPTRRSNNDIASSPSRPEPLNTSIRRKDFETQGRERRDRGGRFDRDGGRRDRGGERRGTFGRRDDRAGGRRGGRGLDRDDQRRGRRDNYERRSDRR